MAVSPLLTQESAASTKITAVKAKSLAVRTSTTESSGVRDIPAKERGPELAEQLNEETRQRYVKDQKIGEGTYAVVYLGHVKSDTESKVAIKKIKVQTEYRDGLAMDAIREVKFLQELSHPNIIALHAVFSSKNQNLNLVLEYLPRGDLEMLIRDSQNISYGTAEIKAWMGMLGRGVWFCHENFVLHRDIKPNNLLIAADGDVKLADFGLARSFADPYRGMTSNVITRWYRPPELLFGARSYSGTVDVWSMGMVFAELILRVPFVAGITDMNQLELICQAIGTPTEANWPGVSKLEGYLKFDSSKLEPVHGRDFYMKTFATAGPLGVDLLMTMLVLDPRKRSTARQVLEHKWWTSAPRPTPKEELPKKGGGPEKMGEDLRRKGGEIDVRGDKVSKKLDFGAT